MAWSDIKIKPYEASTAELQANTLANKYISPRRFSDLAATNAEVQANSSSFRFISPANFSSLEASTGEVQANTSTVRYLSPNNFGDLIATQANQEAGSSAVRYVSPSVQQYHQSAVKGWVNFNGTGTVAINDSYNVTSITDDTTGQYTINWATDFSATGYSVCLTTGQGGSRFFADLASAGSQGAGTTKVITVEHNGTITDCDIICAIAIGDQ